MVANHRGLALALSPFSWMETEEGWNKGQGVSSQILLAASGSAHFS